MYYVAVDIGCLECGEDSAVLGIFTSEKEANDVIEKHEKLQAENWRGQHYFEVWEIGEINKVHLDYK